MQNKWRIGCGVGALVGLGLLAVPVGLLAPAFLGNVPLVDGTELAEGRVITVFDTYVACFLVDVGDGQWVLVDGCLDESAEPIRAALRAQGATLDDVQMLLLTHGHSDHIGVTAARPDLPVRAMAAELPAIEGREPYEGLIPSLMGKVDTKIRVDSPLIDGEVFTVGDARFEAFAMPGHTAGSAAILAHGVLFLGDNTSWKARQAMDPAPWVFTDNSDENVAAIKALSHRLAPRASEIEWLAPSHTGPAKGFDGLASFPEPVR